MLNLLTSENWQAAAAAAVADLPADVRAVVCHRPVDNRAVVITAAAEALAASARRTRRYKITLDYWKSLSEYGWPSEQEALYRSDGAFADRLTWPVLSIRGEASSREEGLFLGRISTEEMKQHLQLIIVEELFQSSAVGTIAKDPVGRFIRDDGTPILDWQFKKRKERP